MTADRWTDKKLTHHDSASQLMPESNGNNMQKNFRPQPFLSPASLCIILLALSLLIYITMASDGTRKRARGSGGTSTKTKGSGATMTKDDQETARWQALCKDMAINTCAVLGSPETAEYGAHAPPNESNKILSFLLEKMGYPRRATA